MEGLENHKVEKLMLGGNDLKVFYNEKNLEP